MAQNNPAPEEARMRSEKSMIIKENTYRSKRITLHRAAFQNGKFHDVYVFDLFTGSSVRFTCATQEQASDVFNNLSLAGENSL